MTAVKIVGKVHGGNVFKVAAAIGLARLLVESTTVIICLVGGAYRGHNPAPVSRLSGQSSAGGRCRYFVDDLFLVKPERPLTHYAMLSIAVAVATFMIKLVAWRLTGSVGLLSDALESLANVAAALVAFASLAVAMKPEDDDHAHGHSKAEYFAAGVEGGLIMVAAVAIGWTAVERFFSPQPITQPIVGLGVSMFASLLNFLCAGILRKVAVKRRSVALEADAQHLMTDVWTSIAVLLAVALVALTGWLWLDPLIGILLAFHIVITGVKLVNESLHGLMDSAVSPAELELIRNALNKYGEKGVQYHALRTRRAGSLKFMSVHLLMPGAWTIARGHDLSEQIETDLRNAIPGIVVVTHLEPEEDPVSWDDVGLERVN